MPAIFTPAEWHYYHPPGSNDFVIEAFDPFTRDTIKVAYVPNRVYLGDHGWPEHNTRHANARLVCASPNLFDVLMRAKTYIEDDLILKGFHRAEIAAPQEGSLLHAINSAIDKVLKVSPQG